ncbi:MAG: hypothetical protein AAF518_27535 [Spirochaetota bacterium]
MNRKINSILLFLIIIFLPVFSVTAQEPPKWYVYASGGSGLIRSESLVENNAYDPFVIASSFSPTIATVRSFLSDEISDFKVPTNHYQIGVEYRLFPFFGLGLGVSRSNYKVSEIRNEVIEIAYTFLLSEPIRDPLESQLNNLSLDYDLLLYGAYNYFTQIVPKRLETNTVDVSLNFHLFGNSIVDPFIGIGGSYGSCNIGIVRCIAPTVTGKAGLQLNLGSFFIFGQAEVHYLIVLEKAGRGGMGIRF